MWPRRLKQLSIFIYIFSLIALGVISLLTVSISISLNENRRLAELPTKPTSLNEFKVWPKKFDTYFNDHLAYRGSMVGLYNLLRIKIGLPPEKSIMVGKNYWMFSNNGTVIEDYRNIIPFSKDEVNRWVQYLKYQQQLAKENNYLYFFILIPNKATIYPEQLPYYIKKVNATSRFDQIKKAAAEEGIKLIDLRDDMLNAKKTGRLYSPYDSHWNLRGAEIAQLTLLHTLKEYYPNIKAEALPTNNYIDVNREEMLNHAVFNWGYLWTLGLLNEPQFIHKQPLPTAIRKEYRAYNPEPLQVEDIIKDRIYANRASRQPFKTENTHAPINLRLLIFRDSFATLWQHFLSKDFSYVAYIREQSDMTLIKSLVKTNQPNIVIEERVERSLRYVPDAGFHYPEP